MDNCLPAGATEPIFGIEERAIVSKGRDRWLMTSKVPLRNRDDLSMAYTPGVGRVSLALAEQAASEGASYIAFGRFFTSQTKPGAPSATPALLAEHVAEDVAEGLGEAHVQRHVLQAQAARSRVLDHQPQLDAFVRLQAQHAVQRQLRQQYTGPEHR